jgi:uncharacterized protein
MSEPKHTSLTREEVVQYLKDHPDFFEKFPDSLVNLKLSHPSGEAISLIERQVSTLRNRNTELRHKLHDLLENARENDRLYQYTKHLVLALLECNELGDLIDAIHYSFDQEFGVQYTQLVLVGEPQNLSNAKFVSEQELHRVLGLEIKRQRSVIGSVNDEVKHFVFGDQAEKIGSAALAILSYGNPLGVLAIGNEDPLYYRTHSGNLFLNHLAEVIARIVFRLRDF